MRTWQVFEDTHIQVFLHTEGDVNDKTGYQALCTPHAYRGVSHTVPVQNILHHVHTSHVTQASKKLHIHDMCKPGFNFCVINLRMFSYKELFMQTMSASDVSSLCNTVQYQVDTF